MLALRLSLLCVAFIASTTAAPVTVKRYAGLKGRLVIGPAIDVSAATVYIAHYYYCVAAVCKFGGRGSSVSCH